MERPEAGREPDKDAEARPPQPPQPDRYGASAAIAAADEAERAAAVESSGRTRASMVLWLVVAAAVAVGVTLYFLYGSAIVPLFGTQP